MLFDFLCDFFKNKYGLQNVVTYINAQRDVTN